MAQTIKAAIELDKKLHSLSDFEIVQYALTHATAAENSSPLPYVLEKVSRMQAYKEHYRIQDTPEEAAACIGAMTARYPGFFLAAQYSETRGNCVAVSDWAAHRKGLTNSPEEEKLFMRGFYYRFQAMSPTFLAIRTGMSELIECDGVSEGSFDFDLFERLGAEIYTTYPKNHLDAYFLNTPTAINVLHGLWKKHMTQNMKRAFQLGHQVEGMEEERISELFQSPTPEIARQNMVAKTDQLLRLRYRHQHTYRLPCIDDDMVLDDADC